MERIHRVQKSIVQKETLQHQLINSSFQLALVRNLKFQIKLLLIMGEKKVKKKKKREKIIPKKRANHKSILNLKKFEEIVFLG